MTGTPIKWFVLKTSTSISRIREIMTREGLEFFFPTFQSTASVKEKKVSREKALVLDLLFVHCHEIEMVRVCECNKGVRPIYQRRPVLNKDSMDLSIEHSHYLVVPDKQMGYFMRTVSMYQNNVPFLSPKEVDMTKGDVVRVIDGPFRGIEGTLISEQGKDGGRVLVQISDIVAIPTMSIAPEFLEILHFAPTGKHAYKKFDAFQKRLDTAIANKKTDLGLTDTDIKALRTFIARYSNLIPDTNNCKAKLLTYLIMAHRLLEHPKEEYEHVEIAIEQLLSNLKSNNTIDFVKKYLSIQS